MLLCPVIMPIGITGLIAEMVVKFSARSNYVNFVKLQ